MKAVNQIVESIYKLIHMAYTLSSCKEPENCNKKAPNVAELNQNR